MDFVAFQNNIIPKESLNFYSLERFRYADACFESILYINGKFPLLSYHQERLDTTANLLAFQPYQISAELLSDLLEKNAIEHKSARLRLSLIRKSGHNYCPTGEETQVLIEAMPTNLPTFSSINKLGLFRDFTKAKNKFSSIKSASALGYVMAKKYAAEQALDDVLIANSDGEWIEASSSNIFAIKDGLIYTSANDSACVHGVVRSFILKHFPVTFTSLDLSFLIEADEIFLTNGINLVQKVLKFEGKSLENRLSREVQEKMKTLLLI